MCGRRLLPRCQQIRPAGKLEVKGTKGINQATAVHYHRFLSTTLNPEHLSVKLDVSGMRCNVVVKTSIQ